MDRANRRNDTARPILPKAPASAKDASGHAIFRVLLEDIAESEFTGEEQYRLEILARLDRFGVAERANLGRLLVERLEAAANVEAGTTTWDTASSSRTTTGSTCSSAWDRI